MSRPPTNVDSSEYPSAMNFQDLMDLSNSTPEECATALPNTNAHRTLANRAPFNQKNHPNSDKTAAINYEDSMLTKMEALRETDAFADVTLLVGEEKAAINAHKLILALASPVFSAMFYGEFANQMNNTSPEVQINSIQPTASDDTSEVPTLAGTSQQLSFTPPGDVRHNILSSATPPGSVEPHVPPTASGSWQAPTVVEIPDCTPDAIKSFLHFIYNNGVMREHHNKSVSVDDALSLLYTARKYNVRDLEDKCVITLSSSILADNVFDILYAAKFYNLSSLDYLCWQFIEDNPIEVLNTHLSYVTHDTFQSILKNDKLNCNEVELFQILMRWADQECTKLNLTCNSENIRRLCAAELKLIRFPLMSGPEFADTVVPTGVLAVEQVAKIFTIINTSADRKKAQDGEDSRSSVLLNGMEFSTQRRTPNNKPTQQQNGKGQSQGTNNPEHEQEETNLINRPPPVFTFRAEQQIMNTAGLEQSHQQQQQQQPVNNVAEQPMQIGATAAVPGTPVLTNDNGPVGGAAGNNENIVGLIDYGIPGVVGIVPLPLSVAPAAAGGGERGRSRQRQSRRNRRRNGSGSNGSNEGQNGQ